MKKRQITIKDIAKSLNVAPSTVSRALADHPDISKETKELVLAFAKEHKYKPNALALSLRTSNTKTIGVILPQIVHFFFSSVLSGIEDEAEKAGYRVIISQSNEVFEREVRGAYTLQESRVCGVLASVAKTTTSFSHFQELIDSGVPVVFFDRICTGILTDRVVVDDYAGVQTAVEYLINTGCRRIAFYGSESHMPISRNRRMGYEDALRNADSLNDLRLPAVKLVWPDFAARADKEGWPAARFLAALAEHEMAERARRRIERHLGEARLPPGKTLDTFDFDTVPMISKAQVMALAAGDSWLEKGANLIMVGPPGAGKSHLGAALGLALLELVNQVDAENVTAASADHATAFSVPRTNTSGEPLGQTIPLKCSRARRFT